MEKLKIKCDRAMKNRNHLNNSASMKKVNFFTMKIFVALSLLLVAGCSKNEPEPTPPEKPSENSTFTAPKNVAAVVVNNGIQISWDKVSGTYKGSSVFDALGYTVEHSSDGSTFTSCGNTEATQTSFIDTNPVGGNNYYRVKAKYDASGNLYTDYSQSVMCTYKTTGGTESGVYLGIIGFNDALYLKDISILNDGTSGSFKSFINNLTMKDNTGLYYAVDNAIGKLQAATLPNDLVNVSIVTFTDGLDNVSTMLNANYTGKDKEIYRNDVKSRINNTKIKNLNITAYSIGIRGNDVQGGAYLEFQANLPALASSANNAIEVTNMTDVNNKFSEIAASLKNVSTSQSIQINMPGGYNSGDKMRFTFDNITDATKSNLYIEGIYNSNGSSFSLQNVVYKGLKSSSGTTVTGVRSGTVIIFTFENVLTDAGGSVTTTNTKHWIMPSSTSQWQPNSEFGKAGDVTTTVTQKSAVIKLVLDCTTSLGTTNFNSMKSAANNFIDVLLGKISISQNAQVRFKKAGDDMYVTEMGIDDSYGNELVSYSFNVNNIISPYYEIPNGECVVWYHDTFPGYEGYFTCFNERYTNFQAGHKYTIICNNNVNQLFFDLTDDGVISSSSASKSTPTVKTNKKVPVKTNGRRLTSGFTQAGV